MPILSKGLLLLALAGVALALFPQAGESSQPSYITVKAALPVFIQGQMPPATNPQSTPGSGPANLGFPTSVLGTPSVQCSAVLDQGPPMTCSAEPPTGRFKCSALCDSGVQCSAFESPTGFGVFCSTLADASGQQAYCSIQVPPTTPGGTTECSAFGQGRATAHITCSTSGEGDIQACSAKQPRATPQFTNQCSAIGGGIQPFSRGAECSVLFGDRGIGKLACSTFVFSFEQRKFCSAIQGNTCSTVIQTSDGLPKGKCTTLRLAPPGTCSALNNDPANGHCSIRVGPGPDANGQCGSH
jgi:hypothetical protein